MDEPHASSGPSELAAATPPAAGGLHRDRIVEAALAIVDEHGLDALSMRRLARALDVAPMSLYRHVRDKAQLMGYVVEALVERLPPVDAAGQPWKERVRAILCEVRSLLVEHPGLAQFVADDAIVTPSVAHAFVTVLDALHEGCPERRDTGLAFAALWTHTVGSVLVEQANLEAHARYGQRGGSREERLTDHRGRMLRRLLEVSAGEEHDASAAVGDLATTPSEATFLAGLDLLLAGIEAGALPHPP